MFNRSFGIWYACRKDTSSVNRRNFLESFSIQNIPCSRMHWAFPEKNRTNPVEEVQPFVTYLLKIPGHLRIITHWNSDVTLTCQLTDLLICFIHWPTIISGSYSLDITGSHSFGILAYLAWEHWIEKQGKIGLYSIGIYRISKLAYKTSRIDLYNLKTLVLIT